MLTILNAAPQTGSGDSELIEMRKWVDQQFTQLIASLKDTLKKVQLLYQEVSQRSLQPSMIYTIVEPLYVDRVSDGQCEDRGIADWVSVVRLCRRHHGRVGLARL